MPVLDLTLRTLPPGELELIRAAADSATAPHNLGDVSSYHRTFWYDLASAPRCLVEEIVRERLQALIAPDIRKSAAGVEWWLGRLVAPYGPNFEFGVHRDQGEHPLTGALESPMLSSVLYLTTVDDGPLVVFPDQPELSDEHKELFFPLANAYARFPGHLYHAVLSRVQLGAPVRTPSEQRVRLTLLVNWWLYRPTSFAPAPMKLVAADYDGSIYPQLRVALASA